jgi:hypothetical protein
MKRDLACFTCPHGTEIVPVSCHLCTFQFSSHSNADNVDGTPIMSGGGLALGSYEEEGCITKLSTDWGIF